MDIEVCRSGPPAAAFLLLINPLGGVFLALPAGPSEARSLLIIEGVDGFQEVQGPLMLRKGVIKGEITGPTLPVAGEGRWNLREVPAPFLLPETPEVLLRMEKDERVEVVRAFEGRNTFQMPPVDIAPDPSQRGHGVITAIEL